MFWGLIMEPGKKYSQEVQKSFHISHAALDLNNAGNDPVQVLLGFDNRNYLICTLQKGKWIQTALDLNFLEGDEISFTTNGPGHVHLTGYLVSDEDEFGAMGEEEESDEDVENEDEVPQLVKKRKADSKVSPVAKKSKTIALLEEVKSDDTDDSDDSDVNLTDMLEDEDGEEEEDDEAAEEEDEDAEEEESDDDDEEDDSDEEVKPPAKETPKQNGVAKIKTPKVSPGKEKPKTPQTNEKPKHEKTPKVGTPAKKTVEGGVVIEDIKVGDGSVAKPGKLVQVYYEGRLKSNNKQFDASKNGPGFKFRLGKQEVIKGWDVGLAGMKVGGKRRITCPPNMAYGAKGSPPVIPPNSALIFEVELKNVKN